jgi:hypothetical protein
MANVHIQREEVRNSLLRRADWRFLLPTPSPVKSVCFAEGRLFEAVALISEQTTDPQFKRADGCDLAVARNPDRATLRAAWDALQSGGSCYTEWSSPLSGGLKSIRRRLIAAGFENISCYWPWPSLARAQFWIPLEAQGALHYFLKSRPQAQTQLRRIGYAIRRMLWLLTVRSGFMFPICATARKPAVSGSPHPAPADPQTSSTDSLLDASRAGSTYHDTIQARWSSWGFGATSPRLSWILLTGGPRSISKVVGLVFAEPEAQPRLAVKFSRVPEAVPLLSKEAAALQTVQSLRPGGVQGVPIVVFSQEQAGLVTVAETAVTGLPLCTLLRKDNYRELALKATDWLIGLAGRPSSHPRVTWWSRLVEPVLDDFSRSFGAVVDTCLLDKTRAVLGTLGDLPLVCEHRDYSPWNVLVTASGELAVLDWERAELQGLPALDLIYFLTYLAFYRERATPAGRNRECYRMTLDPSTLTGGVRSECLARYANHIDLDPKALRPLGLLVWMLHSRLEYQRFVADVVGRPEPAVLRRSLFVSLWQEELQHAAPLL